MNHSETKTDIWEECRQSWLESRRADNTRRAYLQAVEDFTSFSGVKLRDAVRADFLEWRNEMRARGLKPATVSSRLGALNSFYEYANKEFTVKVNGESVPLIDENPVHLRSIRPRVKTYANSRALTVAEVKKILSQPKREQVLGMRDFALLAGYLILGRRNTEWRLARSMDFEMRDGGIFFRWSGKGKTDELLNVPVELWRILQHYIQQSGGRGIEEFIFLDKGLNHPLSDKRVGDIVKRYARKAGIEGNIRVHDLRHTAAMLRREAGADVEEIREFLGHSSLVTTQVYLHRIKGVQTERGGAVCKLIAIEKGKNKSKKKTEVYL